MSLRRLHPDPAELTPDTAFSALALGDLAPPGRPYLVSNMVSTLDGRAAIGGRSGPIGDEVDRQLFHHLRTQADAILVGAGTLRTERYGRLVRDPALREKRVREGLAADPLAVVVTHSLQLPLDIPLFQAPEQTIAIYTSSERELGDCPAEVHVARLPVTDLNMAAVLARLRSDHGVRSILCEGGPVLNRALLADGVMDELFLSVAPKLAGGSDEPTIVGPPELPEPMELELVWALESAGHLYLRYRVLSGPGGSALGRST